MILRVNTDGGSKGNPGPASVGVVFHVGEERVWKYREDIGVATNNVAEYTAVLRAIEHIMAERETTFKDLIRIIFVSDSQLLVRQLKGLYKIKNEPLRQLATTIHAIEQRVGVPVEYHEVRREQNTQADALVNDKAI